MNSTESQEKERKEAGSDRKQLYEGEREKSIVCGRCEDCQAAEASLAMIKLAEQGAVGYKLRFGAQRRGSGLGSEEKRNSLLGLEKFGEIPELGVEIAN